MPFLEFTSDHRYFVDGVEHAAVSAILSQAGLTPKFGMAEAHRERGVAVHKWCEIDDREGADLRKVPKALKGYLQAWRTFKAVSRVEIELIEHRVDCPQFRYSGTLDRSGRLPVSDLPVILDIKSMRSGSPPDYVRYQTVAYAFALGGGKVYERVAVGIRPDGTFSCRFYKPDEFTTDLQTFLIHAENYST